jgi:uncharacterized membrane protein
MSDLKSEIARALAVGAVSGMRTLLMPALISLSAREHEVEARFGPDSRRLLGSRSVTRILSLAAVGEMIGDKLPFTPNRTEPLSLAARAVSGALSAAILASWQGRPAGPPAVLAAASAITAAHLMMRLRNEASRELPDPLVAAAEDCLAFALGTALVVYAIRDQTTPYGRQSRVVA